MNMLDYLAWRGDLTFAQSEFNEVDNLILCYLVYVNLDGAAPGIGENTMTVRDLSERFFEQHTEKELKKDKSFIRLAPKVLKAMASTERFGNLLVQNYVNKIDLEKMLQFAAMEILLGDGTTFIAYRGTDDTIVGWKEDFYLSKGEVPAEKEAVAYLNTAGAEKKELDVPEFVEAACAVRAAERAAEAVKKIRIGGHSKGGNLAVYAAACCEEAVQDRILEIYNNDGPGFKMEFFEKPGYQRISNRIKRYIPESSIIGMLLEHVAEPAVIRSDQKGVMQHDGLSWEVVGPSFIYCPVISNFAAGMDRSIKGWLAQVEGEQRQQVIDDLFAVLEATQAATLTELQDGGLKNIRIIMKEIEEMDSDSKGVLQSLLKEMMSNIPQMLGITELLNPTRKK
ncbi:DUF2974 domain-containing protein [Mediterraneibacter agrestimuris]|uniref:DUF2974 domain-containing protein n=1 Tax=Mediterraneibacter agrestimuris TaxID=2941333 RepID=UPI00203D57BB|nr:DUF2974 domain-containing protein [Mediterraneibacter agrestimuris]